jgi:hypothetical protein
MFTGISLALDSLAAFGTAIQFRRRTRRTPSRERGADKLNVEAWFRRADEAATVWRYQLAANPSAARSPERRAEARMLSTIIMTVNIVARSVKSTKPTDFGIAADSGTDAVQVWRYIFRPRVDDKMLISPAPIEI